MNHQGDLADALRRRIIDGDFAPGSRLSETALAARFEVSRNTLREAFRALTEHGRVPHRGVSVASPTVADVVDIYRVRRVIECTALRHAAPEHPAVQRMREALAASEEMLSDSDWRRVGSANMAFHEAIVALADSPRLTRTFRDVAAELRLVFLEIDDPRSLHEPFLHKNRAVLTTLHEQGPEEAAEELERYLTASERNVLGAFTRMGRP